MAETYERQRRQAFGNVCANCHNGFGVDIDSGHTLVFAQDHGWTQFRKLLCWYSGGSRAFSWKGGRFPGTVDQWPGIRPDVVWYSGDHFCHAKTFDILILDLFLPFDWCLLAYCNLVVVVVVVVSEQSKSLKPASRPFNVRMVCAIATGVWAFGDMQCLTIPGTR